MGTHEALRFEITSAHKHDTRHTHTTRHGERFILPVPCIFHSASVYVPLRIDGIVRTVCVCVVRVLLYFMTSYGSVLCV